MYYILNELLVTEKGENVATVLNKIAAELAAIRVSLQQLMPSSSSARKASSPPPEEEH